MDAGHFIGRGLGGGSGVYFDERNIHAQSNLENAFLGGNPHEYEKFMLKNYGQKVIDELRLKHKTNKYTQKDIIGLGLYYKAEYLKLCKEHSLNP